MHRTLVLIGLAPAILLAQGCVSSERPDPAVTVSAAAPAVSASTSTAQCNADAAQAVVGSLATAEATERAQALAGVETIRVIGPGQPVTQDFNPARLNFETDAGNTIVAVRCG